MTDLKDYEPTPYLKLEGWDDKFVDLEKAKVIDALNRDIRNMNVQKFKVLKEAMNKFLKQNGSEYKYFQDRIRARDDLNDGYYVHNIEFRLSNAAREDKKKFDEQQASELLRPKGQSFLFQTLRRISTSVNSRSSYGTVFIKDTYVS